MIITPLYLKIITSTCIIITMLVIISIFLHRYKHHIANHFDQKKKLKLEDVLIIDNKTKLILVKHLDTSYILLITHRFSQIIQTSKDQTHDKADEI